MKLAVAQLKTLAMLSVNWPTAANAGGNFCSDSQCEGSNWDLFANQCDDIFLKSPLTPIVKVSTAYILSRFLLVSNS